MSPIDWTPGGRANTAWFGGLCWVCGFITGATIVLAVWVVR